MMTTMTQPLRLKAADREDLLVIAACVQDALVLVDDLVYRPEERRFLMVVNRFLWEARKGEAGGERVTAGLTFEGVGAVKRRALDRRQGEGILSLLTVQAEPGAILLEFSGGAGIRLEVEAIDCRLADLGEPWPTQWQPQHPES